MEIILQLTIILIASKLFGSLSVRIGQPAVLGKLLVGIVLGPSLLGWITPSDTLDVLSQIGVILLMFIAGIETDIDEFKRTGKSATFVGFGGIILPLALGAVAGFVLGMDTFEAIFLGLLLSATSVSISVQALKELDQLKTPAGTTILGAAVIDDVVVIIALAFLMSFSGGDVNLSLVIIQKVAFFVGAILVAWKVVPFFLRIFSKLKVTETLVTASLIICFAFAYVAELAGVAAIIGAYIAGVAISATDVQFKVLQKVETISYSVFVPIFFTSIGLMAEFSGILDHLTLIIVLSILAILTKLFGAAAGAKLTGFDWKNSLGIGSAMVSRGEVALILAAIGLEASLLSQDLFAAMIVVVLVTTIVTPPMMKIFFKK